MNRKPATDRLEFTEPLHRRAFFAGCGLGLSSLALSHIAGESASAQASERVASEGATDSWDQRPPHFAPRAKRVIHLHMIGAPSQLDMFDDKPELRARDNQLCPKEFLNGRRFAFIGGELRLAGSKFKFEPRGHSGQIISELLPNLGRVADEMAIVRSLHTNEINHAPAQMFLHTGFGRGGRPGIGSWLAYGLGSENQDLPGYVVLLSGAMGGAGANMWSAGFLPSIYQGIQFRNTGEAVLFLSSPKGHSADDRRRILDATKSLNETRFAEVGDPEITTRIRQYEMAFRMQMSVPELTDLGSETRDTLSRYGAQPGKSSFANNCLLARRLVERGVRIVQLFDSDWDHHADLANRLPAKCRDIDQPIAALIEDLRTRGLLDETLVIWGAEFGRTPLYQGATGNGTKTKPGRDHHKDAYTMWLAGGGVRGGVSFGKTDEFGFSVAEEPVHIHDLNATVLHLLGLDHEKLTYRYQGREFRLTDVHGTVVRKLVS